MLPFMGLSALFTACSPTARKPGQARVRLASPSDVDSLTAVFVQSMQDDPSWPYRFPHCKEYPQDHIAYNRDLMQRFVAPEYDDWAVVLVEVPGCVGVLDADGEKHRPDKLVAFAVWDVSYVNKRVHGPAYTPNSPQSDTRQAGHLHRDADPKHLDAFRRSQAESTQKYFAALGEDQLRLQILGTLPEYRRRGYASLLCRWGMRLAEKDRLAVTLRASAQGYLLYRSLGFAKLGTQSIQAPGEEETLLVICMEYTPHALHGWMSFFSEGLEVQVW